MAAYCLPTPDSTDPLEICFYTAIASDWLLRIFLEGDGYGGAAIFLKTAGRFA